MKKTPLVTLGIACIVLTGAVMAPRQAAAQDPYAGVEVLRGMFKSIDYNRDGRISAREFQVFVDLAFVSMDTNGDSRVSREEFMAWDPGFASVAQERGKTQAFEAAKLEMFRVWDRKGDGSVDESEMSVNAAHDFVGADRDRDGSMSPAEFAQNVPILATIAKALQ